MHSFTKYSLMVLVAGISTEIVPMNNKWEVSFDGEEVRVNGDPSLGHGLTSLAFGLGGTYLGYKVAQSQKDAQIKLAAVVAGGTIGSVVADVMFNKATSRTIFEKTGIAAGTLIGASVHQAGGQYIKDSAALGGHLGGALISQAYGDIEKAKLYIGSGVGEQAGMCIFPDEQKETGRALGVNIGAALAANKKRIRSFYLKKAAVQTVSVQILQTAFPGRETSVFWQLMRNRLADRISGFILSMLKL